MFSLIGAATVLLLPAAMGQFTPNLFFNMTIPISSPTFWITNQNPRFPDWREETSDGMTNTSSNYTTDLIITNGYQVATNRYNWVQFNYVGTNSYIHGFVKGSSNSTPPLIGISDMSVAMDPLDPQGPDMIWSSPSIFAGHLANVSFNPDLPEAAEVYISGATVTLGIQTQAYVLRHGWLLTAMKRNVGRCEELFRLLCRHIWRTQFRVRLQQYEPNKYHKLGNRCTGE
jgi:hypothetical protein